MVRLVPTLQQTYELGTAWAGNSVNCVPFRHSAVLMRGGMHIASFFDPAGDVVVAEAAPDGSVRRHIIANDVAPNDAHQAISLGMDSKQRIHIAWGAHNSALKLCRSRTEKLSEGFSFQEPLPSAVNTTYPMFLSLPQGDLLLIYRRGPHFCGEIIVKRYDPAQDQFVEDPSALISGSMDGRTSGPYLNTPIIAGNGEITLFLVWRLQSDGTSAGAVVNVGIDCLRSRDGLRSLETLNAVRIQGTVTPAYSERVISVPLGANLMNQATAAAMPDGRPAVLTYWDAGDGVPQYRLAWPERGNWRVSVASRFHTPFRLDGGGTLPLPHSRPELVFTDSGHALVIYRSVENNNRLTLRVLSPPSYSIEASEQAILVDEDLGYYEPIVSRAAWRADRSLLLYIQSCQQGESRDGEPDRAQSMARLMRWSMRTSRTYFSWRRWLK